jgi:hypothetical protein
LPLTLVALAFLFARTGIPSWIPPALLVRLGVASPLTGMTRSFVSLASGRVAKAFWWHPLGPLVFATCLGSPLLGRYIAKLGPRFWWCVAAMFAIVWIRQILMFS